MQIRYAACTVITTIVPRPSAIEAFFCGIEFVRNKTSKEPFRSISRRGDGDTLHLGMKDPHNISLYPGTGAVDGTLGDHILIAPAYNVEEK